MTIYFSIMLCADGKTWKIIDFGLAVAKQSTFSRSTLPGLKAGTGTAFYQAPELLAGGGVATRNHLVDGARGEVLIPHLFTSIFLNFVLY